MYCVNERITPFATKANDVGAPRSAKSRVAVSRENRRVDQWLLRSPEPSTTKIIDRIRLAL